MVPSGVQQRRGQIGGELVDARDGVLDRIPTAHQVEVGVADAMDRTAGAQPVVQRIGVPDSGVAEELSRVHPAARAVVTAQPGIDATRVNAVRAQVESPASGGPRRRLEPTF